MNTLVHLNMWICAHNMTQSYMHQTMGNIRIQLGLFFAHLTP